MFTDVQVINLGLSKIASNRIARIAPAQTQLEGYMASNYQHWKRTELAKRRWVFALEEHYQLTVEATLTNVNRPYKYALPIDCLRPVREKNSEWVQRGRYIYSAYSTLRITYIKNVDESEFDPLFNEVLACRIAYESAEYVTQSNAKKTAAFELYNDAIRVAGQCNAFTIGPEDINDENDDDSSWVVSRHG